MMTNGTIRVYVTVDRHTPESIEFGSPEESGWTADIGSREIWESRNDVEPVFEAYILGPNRWGASVLGESYEGESDELHEELRALVQNLNPDFYTDDATTLYAADTHDNYETGESYSYAIHAHVKRYDIALGWVEVSVPFRTLLMD